MAGWVELSTLRWLTERDSEKRSVSLKKKIVPVICTVYNCVQTIFMLTLKKPLPVSCRGVLFNLGSPLSDFLLHNVEFDFLNFLIKT